MSSPITQRERRKRRDGKSRKERIPLVENPEWEQKTLPLLQFVQQPRTWRQLRAWAREFTDWTNDELRNGLAWLSFKGFATYERKKDNGYWFKVECDDGKTNEEETV